MKVLLLDSMLLASESFYYWVYVLKRSWFSAEWWVYEAPEGSFSPIIIFNNYPAAKFLDFIRLRKGLYCTWCFPQLNPGDSCFRNAYWFVVYSSSRPHLRSRGCNLLKLLERFMMDAVFSSRLLWELAFICWMLQGMGSIKDVKVYREA